MYLADLTTQQKFELCLVRILQGLSYAELSAYIAEEWAFDVSRQTIGNFIRSEEGQDVMAQAYDHLRKEYSNEPVIEKSTRVMALREQALKLQALLRTLAVDTPPWVEYSQEFRQYIKQIAIEMDGIQVNVSEHKAAAEVAIEAALAKQQKRKLEIVK